MTSTLVFWWAPSGGDVWVNASCCSRCTKEWEGLHEGEGPAQLLRHSKYKNCLWYRHKEVELSECDVSRVQAWPRKRPSEGRSEEGATHSLRWKEKEKFSEEERAWYTHWNTHTLWHTDSKAGCLQWRSGERSREDMTCCLFQDWKTALGKELDLYFLPSWGNLMDLFLDMPSFLLWTQQVVSFFEKGDTFIWFLFF